MIFNYPQAVDQLEQFVCLQAIVGIAGTAVMEVFLGEGLVEDEAVGPEGVD